MKPFLKIYFLILKQFFMLKVWVSNNSAPKNQELVFNLHSDNPDEVAKKIKAIAKAIAEKLRIKLSEKPGNIELSIEEADPEADKNFRKWAKGEAPPPDYTVSLSGYVQSYKLTDLFP